MHQLTPNWTWTLNCQKYPVYINTYPQGPKFGPFHSTIDQQFSRYKVVKIGNAQNDLRLTLNTRVEP